MTSIKISTIICITLLGLQRPDVLFSQESPITVLTFNIRYDNPSDGKNSWENRKALVAANCVSPDIIGMQEVLKHQLDYLAEKLPWYQAVGVGREDGKASGEFAPVFFRHDRFKLLDQGTFWLSPTPQDTGSVGWNAALTRICTWAKLIEQSSGYEFFILNTHFDHMGDTARAESAKLILDFIKNNTGGLPLILTGDFNCSPADEPYRILNRMETGLTDACLKVGNPCVCSQSTYNGFGNELQPERIDMVYYKGKWQATSYEVLKIKEGEMFISDHWPVVVTLTGQRSAVGGQQSAVRHLNDTTVVQTFTFDSIVTRRAVFQFPDESKRYEKILMYYTLKCDSLTPHDKYPCGEWDYTTYTRVFHRTGQFDSVRFSQPDFVVKGRSPRTFLYSDSPTYTYFESCCGMRHGGMGAGKHGGMEDDRFVRFGGADYVEVPGDAFRNVKNEITVSFWLNGDPFHQPMASTIFEGLDEEGKRVINLHVPYDNGVVYWDAGGHGEGLTDNIYKAARPLDYKGRWTHWTVTKNAATGEQRIYLNGQLFQKGTGLKRTMDGITSFRIGSNGKGNGKFYFGSLDDFTAWNRELDSLEVMSLYLKSVKDYPSDSVLFSYNFNETGNFPIIPDNSGNNYPAKSFGYPGLVGYTGLPFSDLRPERGQKPQTDSIQNAMLAIIIYSDSIHPSVPTDTLHAWPGYHYYCNEKGLIIDSAAVPGAKEILRKTRTWYGKPFEVVEQFEIGRFITPYGKRLDLGLNGFTWIYDVTDYEPLLHGQVDLQAANGQELLDLRFLFIEGTPPRDVIAVKNIWPEGSYKYKDLSDNMALKPAILQLDSSASSFKLRARISGHGEYGPYACCEWAPKMHSYVIDNVQKFDWKVWRDCGMNPVYPQGGTWQFDRAGWCPGTFVDTYDFEITPFVSPGSKTVIDYQIQPYDPDNGEESGNYEMAMHLFEYSGPNYNLELELADILAPGTRQEYRRLNPVSMNPVIRVKNNGADTVGSFIVVYGLEGGEQSVFQWTGRLGFMQSADIILPKPSWSGLTACSVFRATIQSVNGTADELVSNNTLESPVETPVLLPAEFILHVRTQGFGRAADNAYAIINEKGEIVAERRVFEDDSIYHDLIRLEPGAYDLTFTDKNEDGMIRHWWLYWEDPDKVGENGELKILTTGIKEIMNLGYDFAEKRTLQFFVGEPR